MQSPAGMVQNISNTISLKAFAVGMGGVFTFYALLFGYIAMNAETTLQSMQSKLAVEQVKVEMPHASATIITEEDAHNSTQAAKTNALPKAPIRGIYEETDSGYLPHVSTSGLTPFQAYKRPFTDTGTPFIALAIMDFGLYPDLSAQAVAELPAEVSFVMSPYAPHLDEWQQQARAGGHEVWLELPMQTNDYPERDVGPYGLFSHNSLKQNQDTLQTLLTLAPGYPGLVTFTDGAFNDNASILRSIMNYIFSRGLGVLETNPQSTSALPELAKDLGGAYAKTSSLADQNSLKDLERAASQRQKAIAVFPLQPGTLESLKRWVKTLSAKNITLAPLTAIMEPPRGIRTPDSGILSLPTTGHETAPAAHAKEDAPHNSPPAHHDTGHH